MNNLVDYDWMRAMSDEAAFCISAAVTAATAVRPYGYSCTYVRTFCRRSVEDTNHTTDHHINEHKTQTHPHRSTKRRSNS